MITPPPHLRDTLSRISAHLGDMYDGALALYAMEDNPLRYTSTAHALREILREVLAFYAPDKNIIKAVWFTPDPDPSAKSGITRKHRAVYAVYKYVNPGALSEYFAAEVNDIASRIVKQVSALSEYAHPKADTFHRPASEGDDLVNSSLQLFVDLINAIAKGHEELIDCLQSDLSMKMAEMFTNDFFDELDQLSSHTRPYDAEVESITIRRICKDNVHFSGTGTVFCSLQYGSDGDCRRGDGLEWNDSFPFTFKGFADTMNLIPEVDSHHVSIDVSAYEPDE